MKKHIIQFLKKTYNYISTKKWIKRPLLTIIGSFILFILLNFIFPLPDKIEYSTIITDNKGEVIHAFLTLDQKWRMKTELSEISPLLRKTIVEKEDKYFYNHPGVNPLAILRALGKNVIKFKRTSGASTITMQVARMLEPKKRTWCNKIIEMFRAFQLEWKYSKSEILQLYLNLAPYGGNIEGVKSAAVIYFNKAPNHLSLAEITALSIIPNRPSSLVTGKNNDQIITSRNYWLKKFAEEKVFTEKEIQDALNEPLTATRRSVPQLVPQFSLKLKRQGGCNIQSHLDMNTQMKTEKLLQDYVRGLRNLNIRNAAAIIIDNTTHNIITYVGSADFRDTIDDGQVNGAAAVREPGSTLKPLLYGLCFDEGLLTPKTVVTDVAISYAGYAPENYDKKFNGYVTIERALENSLNIPAVKSVNLLGKDKFINSLVECKFESIKKKRKGLGLSVILGGCGSTLEELTGLYSVFANEGTYYAPSFTTEQNSKHKTQVLSDAASYMVTDILSRIKRPDFPLNWESTARMPRIAWKTGTSYGRRDAWSIGYNKKYTVGIWVGNFSGQSIPELSGATIATPLLFKIFNTIDYNSDQEWYKPPSDCEQRMVCPESGLVPGAHCENVIMDYFIPLISSTKTCEHLQEIIVSADEKISYCKSCMPLNGFKKMLIRHTEPEMQRYFEENGIAYQKMPQHNQDCEQIFKKNGPRIISPSNKTEYLISKKEPEPLLLKCDVASDVSIVYWYINNQFYKSEDPRSKIFFMPEEGPSKITCTDDKGRTNTIVINVKKIDL